MLIGCAKISLRYDMMPLPRQKKKSFFSIQIFVHALYQREKSASREIKEDGLVFLLLMWFHYVGWE